MLILKTVLRENDMCEIVEISKNIKRRDITHIKLKQV